MDVCDDACLFFIILSVETRGISLQRLSKTGPHNMFMDNGINSRSSSL